MRLVVLDANVLVSAAIQPNSAPAILLMDWVLEGLVHTVVCPSVLREYREVMQREKFRRYGFPPLWLQFVIDESMQLPDPDTEAWAGPDPDDLTFLALAYQAGAWLVTGNLRHFPESMRNGVVVLSPAAYRAHLEGA